MTRCPTCNVQPQPGHVCDCGAVDDRRECPACGVLLTPEQWRTHAHTATRPTP